eukprot:1628549-Prymnesium_polylepis.1
MKAGSRARRSTQLAQEGAAWYSSIRERLRAQPPHSPEFAIKFLQGECTYTAHPVREHIAHTRCEMCTLRAEGAPRYRLHDARRINARRADVARQCVGGGRGGMNRPITCRIVIH